MSKRTHATKALSMLLALILVLSLFPIMGASASDAGKTISPDGSATIAVGETVTLDGTHNSMASSESWSSSNTGVATVAASGGSYDSDATVTGVSAGTVTITHTINSMFGSSTETFTITVTGFGSGAGEQTATSVTYILYVGNSGSGSNAGVEVARTTVENVSSSDVSAQKLKKSHGLANEIFGAAVTGKEGLLSSDMYSESPTWSGSGPYTVQIYIKKTGQSSVTGAYILSYNGNGNTSGTAPASVTVLGGKTYTVAEKGNLAKTNTTFSQWNTQANGNGAPYAAGSDIKITADTTLYAQWTPTGGGESSGSVKVSKTANKNTVAPNDTFDLTMEAYATGTTVTSSSTVTTSAPMDILLVLDNTYSMTGAYNNTTRLAAMQSAAKSFVSGLTTNEQSKIAMLSFVIGNRQSPTTTDVEWRKLDNSAKTAVNNKIDRLTAPDVIDGYDTCFTQPLQTAASMLNQNTVKNDGNTKIVVFFTDGAATESASTIQGLAANVKASADYVFSIGITANYGDAEKAQAVASSSEYYYDVTNANTLSMADAFSKVSQTIETITSSTSVTLDKDAVLKDIVNVAKFDLSSATATARIYDYSNGWGNPVYSVADSGTTSGAWRNKHTNDGNLTVTMDKTTGKVVTETKTGFAAYEKNSPKHEIYLSQNQGIAFTITNYTNLGTGARLMVGLSTPDGTAANVKFSKASGVITTPIKSSVDMYYPLTPATTSGSSATFMIVNTSSTLLCVTNLKVIGNDTAVDIANGGAMVLSADEAQETPAEAPLMLQMVVNADTMRYAASFENLEEYVEPDEPDTPDTPDTPDEPAPSAEPEPTATPSIRTILRQVLSNFVNHLFNSFSRLFGRR